MEPTPFNLEHAIDQYIATINNQGSLTNADVMELTDHLYDATADLQQNNLTEEEAFLVATKRLGNESLLTQEYSKVNPSINASKVWAYLFIGFNLLSFIPTLIIYGVSIVYYLLIKWIDNTNLLSVGMILFNLAFSAIVWLLARKKNAISAFVEKQVASNAIRVTLLSFLPLGLLYSCMRSLKKFDLNQFLFFPMRGQDNVVVELTFYVGFMSLIGGSLALIFSLKQTESVSIKGLFERPSYLFLICCGIFVEFAAAFTRALQTELIIEAIFFGLIYLTFTFLISYYNKTSALKYISVFVAFGLIAESSLGISNDLDRGNFYHTTYFVSALLLGVFSGWMLGLKYGKSHLSNHSTSY